MTTSAGIAHAMRQVRDALRTGGVSADIDPEAVNLPGVWIHLGTVYPDRLNGDGSVDVLLSLLAANTAHTDAIQHLDQLLPRVLDVVDPEGDIIPQSVVMPGPSQTTLPSLLVTCRMDYTKESSSS